MKISKDYEDFRNLADNLLAIEYSFPEGNMSWVKKIKLSNQPIAFDNNCVMYFDESSLPPFYSDVTELSNKYVVYGIYCNGKFYIGSTSNFGERMSTHSKDSKKDMTNSAQMLYSDMKTTHECISFVFAVVDSEDNMKQAEHSIIALCKDFSINKACNYDENYAKFIKEGKEDAKKKALKYCYNIVD